MATSAPKDLILEPSEHVLLATRPLFLWEPLVLLDVLLIGAALYFSGARGANPIGAPPSFDLLAGLCLIVAILLLLWIVIRWIPWSRRWYVLTDRRVIARWGVLNRNQAALLLDRIQDASLSRPFPLSMLRDYGVLHLESAGEHAQERISAGLQEISMTQATTFYRMLTDAQTKEPEATVRM
ncbi:MAG TPA: PH domain-containing protein [Candidatus Limnocylindrales bacterium]|nr:PH domain-containing protein [Candidatus Limnocylindrales bacterium]